MAALSSEVEAALPLWVHFKSTPVNYPAYSTDLLKIGDVGTYADGVRQGDRALHSLLDDVQDVCPDELEILAGYSSGAMVVHDILDDVAGSNRWQSHIAGVHLLADPRRTPSDPVTRGGAGEATFGIAAIGDLVTPLRGTAQVPPVFGPITRSWCASGDPICGLPVARLSLSWLTDLLDIHASRHGNYGISTLPNVFVDEARRLARRFNYQFPPTPQFLDTIATGWPANIDLKQGFEHSVRFTDISPAIPGLKLSANGLLSGIVPTIAPYHSTVTAVTNDGGTTKFDIYLNVVEPFDMVPFDLDPVVLAPMPLHQPTGVTLPGIAPRSVVTLEPEDTMPAGITLSAAGKIQGRPDLIGDFTAGVRVARPDGTLRRFQLKLQVINPAKLVSATQDGTPSDSSVRGGIMLDDSHVAFVSAATNLGVDNPDYNDNVYVKSVDSGVLAHWSPPSDEYVCAVQTDATKTTLYILTGWVQVLTDDNGDQAYVDHTTIRSLPVAGQPDGGGEMTPQVVTSFTGYCNNGRYVAPATARGTAVISDYRLDLPGQPYGSGTERLYTQSTTGFTQVRVPPTDGLAWLPSAVVDVRPDGALLVEHQRPMNTGEPGPPQTETGYFLLSSTGTWRAVNEDAVGAPIKMLAPSFYAGGLVFSMERTTPATFARRAAVISPSGMLRFKPIAVADPVPFDSLDINSTSGIQPLTSNDYAVGCHTYMRSKPVRAEPTMVYFGGFQLDSCIARPPTQGASPFSAGGSTSMLVGGSVVADGPQQLLVAAVP